MPFLAVIDTRYPAAEHLPRKLEATITEEPAPGGGLQTNMHVTQAERNPFRPGDQTILQTPGGGKLQGFEIGQALGKPVITPEGAEPDNYRFRTVQYLANMALMGWSPHLRSMLRLQRWSHPAVAQIEDGERALDAETAMAAVAASNYLFASASSPDVRQDLVRQARNMFLASVTPTLQANAEYPTMLRPRDVSSALRTGTLAIRLLQREFIKPRYAGDDTVRTATVVANLRTATLQVRVGASAAFYGLTT